MTAETLLLRRVVMPGMGVTRLDLHRPKQLNAFHDGLFEAVGNYFRQSSVEADPQPQVVILGGGESKHFTAGLDLKDGTLGEILQGTPEEVGRRALKLQQLVKRWQDCLSAVEDYPMPVLAAIDGACIGAGMDLVTCCDMRYCTQTAYFCVKEVDIGLAADLGTLQRLSRCIGSQSTVREWCYTARKVSAQEALREGLVSRVFASRQEMDAHVVKVAAEIAAKSPIAVHGTKRLLLHARDHASVQEGLQFTRVWNSAMLQSEDVRASLEAAISKQKPTFSKL